MDKFRIILKGGKYKGEIPTDDIKLILESIDAAYYHLLGFGRSPHRRQKIEILIKTIEGSVGIEWSVNCSDEKIREKSEKPWEEIIEFIRNPENAKEEDMYALISLLQLKKIGRNRYERIIFSYNGREEELKPEWIDKTEKFINAQKKEAGKVILWGKLMEGDFRDGKFKCRLISLEGREVRCIYPQRLEERIHYFLHPLRRDVIINGIRQPNNTIEIIEIEGQGSLFDYKIDTTENPSIEKFFGVAKHIEGSADEITDWMKKTIWGE